MSWHIDVTVRDKAAAQHFLTKSSGGMPQPVQDAVLFLVKALPDNGNPIYIKSVGHIDGEKAYPSPFTTGGNASIEVRSAQVYEAPTDGQ